MCGVISCEFLEERGGDILDKLMRFIDLYWPIEYCNLNCPYCYVHQHKENKGKRYRCSHSPEEIRNALSQQRLGGICLVNICAGGGDIIRRRTYTNY